MHPDPWVRGPIALTLGALRHPPSEAHVRHKDVLGRLGEDLAARHLSEQGFTILERNWRCSTGEIDIVALDGDVLIICEVKTRSSLRFGSPLEAVTADKAARLQRLGYAWMREHDVHAAEVRFDVVAIVRSAGSGTTLIEHHRRVV